MLMSARVTTATVMARAPTNKAPTNARAIPDMTYIRMMVSTTFTLKLDRMARNPGTVSISIIPAFVSSLLSIYFSCCFFLFKFPVCMVKCSNHIQCTKGLIFKFKLSFFI